MFSTGSRPLNCFTTRGGHSHSLLQIRWEGLSSAKLVEDLAGDKVGVLDTDPRVSNGLFSLRKTLTTRDRAQYRLLGVDTGDIIGNVCRSICAGQTELSIAAELTKQCLRRGIDAVVTLIAADDRMDTCRHPLPTSKPVSQRVMVVVCGRRHGLIASATRIVHFGPVSNELRKKHDAVTYIDARVILASREGKTGADMFQTLKNAYEERGFGSEWQFHHQGGATGYKT